MILACRRQIARVAFDRAKQAAGGGGELVNAGFKLAVARAQDRVFHGRQMVLAFIHGVGDAVGLEVIDAFHALVAQRVRPEGDEMQDRARKAEAERAAAASVATWCRQGQATNVSAVANSLRGMAGLRATLRASKAAWARDARLGKPRGKDQDAEGRKAGDQVAGADAEGIDQDNDRRQKTRCRMRLSARVRSGAFRAACRLSVFESGCHRGCRARRNDLPSLPRHCADRKGQRQQEKKREGLDAGRSAWRPCRWNGPVLGHAKTIGDEPMPCQR